MLNVGSVLDLVDIAMQPASSAARTHTHFGIDQTSASIFCRACIDLRICRGADQRQNPDGALLHGTITTTSESDALPTVRPPAVDTVDARRWWTLQLACEISIQFLCPVSADSPLIPSICRYTSVAMMPPVFVEVKPWHAINGYKLMQDSNKITESVRDHARFS